MGALAGKLGTFSCLRNHLSFIFLYDSVFNKRFLLVHERMAEDREILREIWAGRLPICFSLASEEVSTPMAPDPFYLMVPRMTYFPLVTEKVLCNVFLIIANFLVFYDTSLVLQVRRHFVRCVVPEKQDNEMWLEFEKHPLKWFVLLF